MRDSIKEIVEEFEYLPEWLDKYNYLIELADRGVPFEAADKTPENLIEGCQSRVWITVRKNEDGTVAIAADSDAIIVKGITVLLVVALDGLTPSEILAEDFEFIDKIGLRQNLSPTRAGGLSAMIQRIRTVVENF